MGFLGVVPVFELTFAPDVTFEACHNNVLCQIENQEGDDWTEPGHGSRQVENPADAELPLVPHKHGASRGLPTVQKEPWFPSP